MSFPEVPFCSRDPFYLRLAPFGSPSRANAGVLSTRYVANLYMAKSQGIQSTSKLGVGHKGPQTAAESSAGSPSPFGDHRESRCSPLDPR